MKITDISIYKLSIPLIRPFITAVRTTNNVEDIVIMIKTDVGNIGYGSAASTPLITGDTISSIIFTIKDIITPKLLGQDIAEFNKLISMVQTSIQKNTSAKAAVDIALYDLFAQYCNLPLYKLFGGINNKIKTCITVSAKTPNEMANDARLLVNDGYTTLKLKVGVDPILDVERVSSIRQVVGNNINLIVDANQAWHTKQALGIIHKLAQYNIQFIEQPVRASDLTNLKVVKDNVPIPVIADESCFTQEDALNIIKSESADGINIKLMKCGGLSNAQIIYNLVTTANLYCMVGCMLESPIGIAAITSFAVSKPNLFYADLDAIALIKNNPINGGAKIIGNTITLSDDIGLGIKDLGESVEKIK